MPFLTLLRVYSLSGPTAGAPPCCTYAGAVRPPGGGICLSFRHQCRGAASTGPVAPRLSRVRNLHLQLPGSFPVHSSFMSGGLILDHCRRRSRSWPPSACQGVGNGSTRRSRPCGWGVVERAGRTVLGRA